MESSQSAPYGEKFLQLISSSYNHTLDEEEIKKIVEKKKTVFHEERESAQEKTLRTKSSSAPIRKQFGREAFDLRKKASLASQNMLLNQKENCKASYIQSRAGEGRIECIDKL